MQCLCLGGLHTVPFHPMGDGQCAKSQILTFKSVVLNDHQESIFTYPSFILDVDVGFPVSPSSQNAVLSFIRH